MKKILLVGIITVLLVAGLGCVITKTHCESMAKDVVEELKKVDNDGCLVSMKEHGLFGYEVIYHSSIYDEEPQVYVIDAFEMGDWEL